MNRPEYKVNYNIENDTIEIIDIESKVVLTLPKEVALDFAFAIELKVYQAVPRERTYNGIF